MSTYNPPSIPCRPKSESLAALIQYHLRLAYFRYSVTFGLYVMTPGEKLILNSIVLSIVGLLLYYVFPLAVSTLAWALFHFVKAPKPDSLRVHHIMNHVNMGAASLTEGGAPAMDTNAFRRDM